MKELLKSYAKRLLGILPPGIVCRVEYRLQRFSGINERPIELSFVFRQLARICPQSILDVGTGTTALPQVLRGCGYLVTASDNIRDYWQWGMVNRHFYVVDDDITRSRIDEKFDVITCVSVLEHIEDSTAAFGNMLRLLNEGGHLILTCPFSERDYVPNVYACRESSVFGNAPSFICQSYSRAELANWLKECGGEIVDQEYWRVWSGDFWTAGEKLTPPLKVDRDETHQLTCLLVRKS